DRRKRRTRRTQGGFGMIPPDGSDRRAVASVVLALPEGSIAARFLRPRGTPVTRRPFCPSSACGLRVRLVEGRVGVGPRQRVREADGGALIRTQVGAWSLAFSC